MVVNLLNFCQLKNYVGLKECNRLNKCTIFAKKDHKHPDYFMYLCTVLCKALVLFDQIYLKLFVD